MLKKKTKKQKNKMTAKTTKSKIHYTLKWTASYKKSHLLFNSNNAVEISKG